MSTPSERQAMHSARWYRTHREDFLASLKGRYAADPEFRRFKKRYAEQYERRRAEGYFPDFRPLYRDVGGEQVQVFRLSEVARDIGRSTACVRLWEHTEQIPPPTFERRLYTEAQAGLLRLLADAYPAKDFVALRRKISAYIWENWK